jgi:hypothetical protein
MGYLVGVDAGEDGIVQREDVLKLSLRQAELKLQFL